MARSTEQARAEMPAGTEGHGRTRSGAADGGTAAGFVRKCLGEDYDSAADFFRDVMEHPAEYKIICGERCMALLDLFRRIFLSEGDPAREAGAYLDACAMEGRLDELRRSGGRILLAGDIFASLADVGRLRAEMPSAAGRISVMAYCHCADDGPSGELPEPSGSMPVFRYELLENLCRFSEAASAGGAFYGGRGPAGAPDRRTPD